MLRVTDTDKWKDKFFRGLKPLEKLVFMYLNDNCNDAGFMDVDFEQMAQQLKMGVNDIRSCLNVLRNKILVNKDKSKIWVKKFLFHQQKLPLLIKSEEGKRVLQMLEASLLDFEESKPIQDVIDEAIAKKSRTRAPVKRKPFVKPTLDEAQAKFADYDPENVTPKDVESIYMHYQSVGWVVGKKPMKDWVSAFTGCFVRNAKKAEQFKNPSEKKTRMDKIIEANEEKIDYNQLRDNGRG